MYFSDDTRWSCTSRLVGEISDERNQGITVVVHGDAPGADVLVHLLLALLPASSPEPALIDRCSDDTARLDAAVSVEGQHSSGQRHDVATCNFATMTEQLRRSVRDRVAAHLARLRRHRLRPGRLWVPDVQALEFAAEAHRQSALAAASPHATEEQAFVDAVSWLADEDEE